LTWQRCEDPSDQATFHEVIKDIDDGIKRIENHSDLQTRTRLMEEGEKVKKAIAKSSASPASYLFIIEKNDLFSLVGVKLSPRALRHIVT